MAEMAAPFLWGSGGQRLTPEQIDRQRKIAAALAKQGGDYSPVQHWAQGAARAAQAMLGGYEERQANAAEKVNATEDAGLLSGLLSGMGGAAPSAAPAMATGGAPTSAAGAPSGAAPASFAEVAPRMKADLVRDFGLNDVQAAAFTGNLAHESGGFNSLQEINPTVPGSRGGFGYAQWTGPRRREFENWTAQNGLDPTSYEANYGFLKHELTNTGEGKVLQSLRQANDPATATQIVSDQFLRPGIPGMASRQKWTQRALTAENGADMPAPGAMPAEAAIGQPGFAVPPAEPAQPLPMTAQTFNAIQGGEAVQPVFQSEGASQPWMGTAIPQQAPQVAQAPAPMPPPRPADLPAPGAVEAIGQMPPPQQPAMPDLSNANDAGARQLLVASEEQRRGLPQGAQATGSPLGRVTAAFAGGGQPQPVAAPQSPAVAKVAQAVAQNPGDPLVQALTSPYASEATKKVAMAMLMKKIEGNDTRGVVMGERLIDPKTGRVIADYTNPNGASTEYGLAPIYGTDKDGNPAVVQLGKRGDAKQSALPQGFKIARDPIKVDGPTGTTLLDPQTRQQIGFIPKDIAGAEGQKIEGKAAAEAKIDMPGAIAKAEQSLATIEAIRNHPGRSQFGATGWGSQLPIVGDGTPGTKGRDFVGLVEQMKGKAFLEAFGELKGGGAISEGEGSKATAAIARLDRAQSKEGFDAALKDIEDVVRSGIERAKRKAGGASAPAAAPPAAIDTSKPGTFRFNPATGKMEPM